MPRPASRRRAAVVGALVAVAMLGACTGNSDEGTTESRPTPVVAPTVAQSDTEAVVTAAVTALADAGASGEAARAATFTGSALTTANAWAKTLPARTDEQKAAAAISPTGAKVLAVSRVGAEPRLILAQATLKESGAAVLVLLESGTSTAPTATGSTAAPRAGGPGFRIAAITPMLPEAKLDALDPLTTGSAPIGDGDGLVAQPADLLTALAGSLDYPEAKPTELLANDPWTEQLRKAATAQADALKDRGVYTQEHEAGDVIGGLRLKDGQGAIVFADINRVDGIALRQATKLTPSKDFTLLTGTTAITSEAQLKFTQTVAVVIPATGVSRVVAAADQLVGGSGR